MAVTGPSGSARSCNMLGGLAAPTSGVIFALGERLDALDRSERAAFRREHVAVISQQICPPPFLSARENVELALAMRGRAPEDARRDAADALEAVRLGERLHLHVAHLSAGERQRVAIALGHSPAARTYW